MSQSAMTPSVPQRDPRRRDPRRRDELGLLPEKGTFVRTRVDPFPLNPWARWALRLALSLPYLAVAVFTWTAGVATEAPIAQTVERVQAIDWTQADIGWVADLYPPVGTLIVTILTVWLPLDGFAVAVVGALAAGVFMQKVTEAMVQRRLRPLKIVLFLIGIAFNPFTIYLATQDTLLFIALGLFLLGAGETVRFLYWSSTRDGFRAGVLLMVAALTHPLGVAFVAVAGLAAFFYVPDDLARPGRRRASLLVATYPTIGAFATVGFLSWVFGGVTAAEVADVLSGSGDRFVAVLAWATGPRGALLAVAVVLTWILALAENRARSIVFSVVAIAVYSLALVAGVGADESGGAIWLMVYSLVILFVRRAETLAATVAAYVLSIGGIAIVWAAAALSPTIQAWAQVMLAAL